MKYVTFDTEGILGQRLIKGIHQIPDNAVPVDDALFARLVQEQDGLWVLGVSGTIEKRPLPTVVPDYAQIERTWRNSQLQSSEWLAARHRDESDLQGNTTLSAVQFVELLTYRQALRDWPAAEAFPDSPGRPGVPSWFAAHLN